MRNKKEEWERDIIGIVSAKMGNNGENKTNEK